ncbi:MAG: MFS transporter [Gammaproteobacteria bacterium]
MTQESQFSLLKQRRFAPFFWVQFLGAFNDNVYKNALVIMLAFQVGSLSARESNTLINLSAGLFILPFFLFSATSGQLADKYEKSLLIRYVVLIELGLMSLGVFGFYWKSVALLMFTLFLGGVQSALFGPVKYAILPQHLKPEEIVGGNGLVEMGTFVAILLGTILGGVLIAEEGIGTTLVSITTIVVAAAGYAMSRFIPNSPPPAPELRINWNPFTETMRNLRFARGNRTVFLSMLGISWFWFYGATFLAQFPSYTKEVLGGDESVVTLLLALFSIGIGAGSLLCERLSGHRVELGLVPFGSIGLTLFAIDLYFAAQGLGAHATADWLGFLCADGAVRVVADLVLIGVFGGFFIVPLYALIQLRSEPSHRSRIIAGNNILNALFMVGSALFAIVLGQAGVSVAGVLLLTGLVNAAVALYLYILIPEFLMRFIVWLCIHSVYRVRHQDLSHIPECGPGLLVCREGGARSAFIIAAACRRPVRFLVPELWFRIPILGFVLRAGRAIVLGPAGDGDPAPAILRALEAGDLLCWMGDSEGAALRALSERTPVIPITIRTGGDSTGVLRRLLPRLEVIASPAIRVANASIDDDQAISGEGANSAGGCQVIPSPGPGEGEGGG